MITYARSSGSILLSLKQANGLVVLLSIMVIAELSFIRPPATSTPIIGGFIGLPPVYGISSYISMGYLSNIISVLIGSLT